MSVFNGYKDVLVRKDGDVFKVDGLSPKGHEFVNENFSFAGDVAKAAIGFVVSQAIGAGLSVEVR